ncbi:hypothetical protein CCHR01_03369 [Colletotrichum chrysophilum]|uniref:Uncharacterized protein n=1 Tax=Colletotrichum chrysophilum TaxID=1836956 RepID=A0AAD9ERF3_9PEZI|nr:hypothetical protein CCHR01_03369 [Colletotrichum chrysophilum]
MSLQLNCLHGAPGGLWGTLPHSDSPPSTLPDRAVFCVLPLMHHSRTLPSDSRQAAPISILLRPKRQTSRSLFVVRRPG